MTRIRPVFILLISGLLLAACGGGGNATPIATTRPGSPSPTPLSTALPTIIPQAQLGSLDRPFHLVMAAPTDNAVNSDLDTALLAAYLQNQTGVTVAIDLLASSGDALHQLCGGDAAFAWLDGAALLTALDKGCGTPALKIARGTDLSTGVKADLIVRVGSPIASAANATPSATPINAKATPTAANAISNAASFKGRDFCRLVDPDAVSWILPALAMRAAGLNPANDLKGVKLLPDSALMVQAVADGICVSAGIPAGSLNSFSPTLPPGVSLVVMQTTPELPFGGLVIASNVPRALADSLTTALADPPDTQLALIAADSVAPASTSDYADFQRFALAARLNLNTLGQ